MVTSCRAFWAAFTLSVLRKFLILTESERGILTFSSNGSIILLSSGRLLCKEDKTVHFSADGFTVDKACSVKPTDILSGNHLPDKGLKQHFCSKCTWQRAFFFFFPFFSRCLRRETSFLQAHFWSPCKHQHSPERQVPLTR